MKDFLKKLLGDTPDTSDSGVGKRDVRVATCALFLEMAAIDGEFSDSERDFIVGTLKTEYSLSDDAAQELAAVAGRERKEGLDLWRFARVINERYTREEKLEVVELMWRLVYADGKLDDHEQYLMTKLRKVLRVTHRDLIDAKLRVLHGG